MKRPVIITFKVMLLLLFVQNVSEARNMNVNPKEEAKILGLYSSDDKVEVLSHLNYKTELYNRSFAWLLEFYNSFCGFCRKFAPLWQQFAAEIYDWKNVVRIGAIDCAVDENNGICRDFEVLMYPSLRYFNEWYEEGPKNIGEAVNKPDTLDGLVDQLVEQLQSEQLKGRGENWPNLSLKYFNTAAETWYDLPSVIEKVIVIFETADSLIASKVSLDFSSLANVKIWRVLNTSNLAKHISISHTPYVVSIDKGLSNVVVISTKSTRQEIKSDIIEYLTKNKIDVSIPSMQINKSSNAVTKHADDDLAPVMHMYVGNTVFQSDLEAGLKYSLTHEITTAKKISGEAIVTLKKYLQVILRYFPFKANSRSFVSKLYDNVKTKSELGGEELSQTIQELENEYNPVFSTSVEWMGCKGSFLNHRGYTCSLWTIFHLMTVGEALDSTGNKSDVLDAMVGYVKHFFGCTECSRHFQEMVQQTPIDSFTSVNNKYVYWLWFAHNKVNHRLAGDKTEDPNYPKRQFPYERDCPKCRLSNGDWNVDEVMNYLKEMYNSENVNLLGTVSSKLGLSGGFSRFDMTILSVLYIYCFIALIFIFKLLCTKKMYKRKMYFHDALGKV